MGKNLKRHMVDSNDSKKDYMKGWKFKNNNECLIKGIRPFEMNTWPVVQGGSDKSGTLSKLHCCIKN